MQEKKIDYTVVEYIKKGLSIEELKKISRKLDLAPSHFIRKKDKTFKEKNVEFILNDDQKLFKVISENPKLLERPIVIQDERAIIARPAELLHEFLL